MESDGLSTVFIVTRVRSGQMNVDETSVRFIHHLTHVADVSVVLAGLADDATLAPEHAV